MAQDDEIILTIDRKGTTVFNVPSLSTMSKESKIDLINNLNNIIQSVIMEIRNGKMETSSKRQ